MKPLSLFAILFLLAISSCKKKTDKVSPVVGDYFIYGYANENSHSKFYKVADSARSADTSWLKQKVTEDVNRFKFDLPMSVAAYDSIKECVYNIPPELFSMNNTIIGEHAHANDLGYLDVRVRRNGIVYRWKFLGEQRGSTNDIYQFYHELTHSIWLYELF